MHAERIKEGEFALQTARSSCRVHRCNARELTAEAIAGTSIRDELG